MFEYIEAFQRVVDKFLEFFTTQFVCTGHNVPMKIHLD